MTDGAVELRDRSPADTLEDLRAVVERDVEDVPGADALCAVLHDHVRRTTVDADDAALLVCAVEPSAWPAGGHAPVTSTTRKRASPLIIRA